MKKALKVIGIVVAILAVVIIGGIIYLKVAFPKVDPAPEITIDKNPAMIERGKYLANHVTVCIDCHSSRNWTEYSGPVIPGTEGKGGDAFTEEFGFPGKFYAKNITPANLKDWTDGEIFRLITTGVTKDNKAIFPVMPYPSYNKMAAEDVKAIIAYIRTLHPIQNEIPERQINFPMNLILPTIPQNYTEIKRPDTTQKLVYGEYLVRIAACRDCHTPAEKGKPIEGMELAGGFEFKLPMGTVRSANITQDIETGIGTWSEDMFVQRFKSFDGKHLQAQQGGFNTVMPWTMYGGMTESDLRAIFTYLRTVKPVKHAVTKFTPKG